MITDTHGRKINYLRLAVTDRCNLRCSYCMPHEGLNWLNRNELLSYEEMLRLCSVFIAQGIDKIRITGGEPFVRKDMMGFIRELSKLKGLDELSITTNGVATAAYVPELKELGVRSVNLSLDTLDRQRFLDITHRDELDKVMHTLNLLLEHDMDVKINAVVMADKNIEDIIPLAELTKLKAVSVRFIEEMPFNGSGGIPGPPEWVHARILEKIRGAYPDIYKVQDAPHSTSYNYNIPGHEGSVGIIAAYTRSFCGTCNRVRVTPDGTLKTCLYEGGGLNVRDVMRAEKNDEVLAQHLLRAISKKPADGWEAENRRSAINESMATIGG